MNKKTIRKYSVYEILIGSLYQTDYQADLITAAAVFNIDLVIDLIGSIALQNNPLQRQMTVVSYAIDDGEISSRDYLNMEMIADLAVEHIKRGQRVLTQCTAGLNRSSLMTGMILKKLGFTGQMAIDIIRRTRGSDALSNQYFRKYLET